jgi:hypothetical protein
MKYLILFFPFLSSYALMAQQSPVKWSFELKSKNMESAEFTAKADISKGWNIYSVYMDDGGPVPTSFAFEEIIKGSLIGQIVEKSEKISAYDELFEMKVIKYKNYAEFSQIIAKSESTIKLKGNVLFMCCDSQRCLPPSKIPFDLKL